MPEGYQGRLEPAVAGQLRRIVRRRAARILLRCRARQRLTFNDCLEGFQVAGVPAGFVPLELGAGVAAQPFEAVVK